MELTVHRVPGCCSGNRSGKTESGGAPCHAPIIALNIAAAFWFGSPDGSLCSAGWDRAASTLEGNERQELSASVSPSPSSVPLLQDDSCWEGVHGAWGWRRIPWQAGPMKKSGAAAFSPDQMCRVNHTDV